ncbi:MAG: hypothetical protein WDN45_09575 [Caulobacteraceae bacterium]
MSVQSLLSAATRIDTAPARRVARHGVRWAMVLVGCAFIPVGIVGAVLPTHLGAIFLVIGLALILRGSTRPGGPSSTSSGGTPRWCFPLPPPAAPRARSDAGGLATGPAHRARRPAPPLALRRRDPAAHRPPPSQALGP